MWIPQFIIDFAAKQVGSEIKKEITPKEGSMETTPWYKTPSTLTHIFAGLITVTTVAAGIYTGDFGGHVPDLLLKIGGFVLTVAHAVGIYDNHANQ
jgi:hypothetical protein